MRALDHLALACLATVVAAVPLILGLAHDLDYFAYANESIGYRYFFVVRLLSGETGALWMSQGQLTSLVQSLAYSVTAGMAPPSGGLLEHARAVGFIASLLAPALIFAALAFYSRTRPSVVGWAGVLVSALGPLYATSTAGFYYGLLPDYYAIDMAFVPVVTVGFLFADRSPKGDNLLLLVLLATIAGLVASNKISLLPFASIPLVPLLARRLGQPALFARDSTIAGVVCVLVFALVWFALYRMDIATIARVAPVWFNYVFNPGGEPNFWQQLPLFLGQYNYAAIVILGIALFAIYTLRFAYVRQSGEDWFKLATLAGVGSLSIWMIIRRPAGTTAFEVACTWLGIVGILIAWRPGDATLRWCGAGAAVCAAAWSIATFDLRSNLNTLDMAAKLSRETWALHREVMAPGQPVILVIPDNNWGVGSVEEAMLKGFADFPTWNITTGRSAMRRFMPDLTFRHEYGDTSPAAAYPADAVIMWSDVAGAQALTDRFPSLAEAVTRNGMTCRQRSIPPGPRVMTACFPPSLGASR